ncbi:hypothetical protein ACP8HI_20385 [Paenibacillus sp. FA6]|uniref:hypothetical protein n=1 Tax=Paenibacillus sp. FA6 TaxID=3413029 RepID=UPI003F65AE8F
MKDMSDQLKRICLDLRPLSLINREEFDEFYSLLNKYQHEINRLNVLPKDFAWALIYTSYSMINQCNYTKYTDDLMNEWDRYNKAILRVFKSEVKVDLDIYWINNNIFRNENEVLIIDLSIFLQHLYSLIKNNEIAKYNIIIQVALNRFMT